MTGTGLGLGTSGRVRSPDLTSDMIFAAIGEELGFLGIILIVCLFATFVGEGFFIAQRATSDYVRLAAIGLTALMGFQAFFIMAGVLARAALHRHHVAVRRVRRSSLFANYLVVALLLRISDENSLDQRGGEIVAVKFKNSKPV